MDNSYSTSGIKLKRGTQPLYITLANLLSKDIQEGRYKPSSTLPSEKELIELYGVSRVTVRQSMRVLREQGLISSHAGIGTIVRYVPTTGGVFNAVNSTEELLQFVGNTEMHAVSLQEVIVDAELAAQLECAPNLLLSEACFLRKNPGQDLPMSFVRIYVHPQYAQAQQTEKISSSPIFQNIEKLFNVQVTEIRQDVTATLLDAKTAHVLQAKEHDAALQITRFFFDVNQAVMQVSVSFYPADRYKQSARFRATRTINPE